MKWNKMYVKDHINMRNHDFVMWHEEGFFLLVKLWHEIRRKLLCYMQEEIHYGKWWYGNRCGV